METTSERERFTLSVYTENSPGVIQRITTLFTRRKLNIDSIAASETEAEGVSRFTIILRTTPELVAIVAKQLRRIIEVFRVDVFEDHEVVVRELAFFRFALSPHDVRREGHKSHLFQLAEECQVKVVDLIDEGDTLLIQGVGTREGLIHLCDRVTFLPLVEFLSTGGIATAKRYQNSERGGRPGSRIEESLMRREFQVRGVDYDKAI